MDLAKLVLLLIAGGVFGAVTLSTLTVVLIVAIGGWIAAFVASLSTREGKGRERAPKMKQLAGQERT